MSGTKKEWKWRMSSTPKAKEKKKVRHVDRIKNVKVLSWNVDGLRATVKKGLLDPPLLRSPYDIVCLQETKCLESQIELSEELRKAYPYRAWSENRGLDHKDKGRGDGQRKGLSGTAIFSKHPFLRIIPSPEPIREGRLCIVEFPHFIVVSVYVPNSGSKHEYRVGEWDEMFCSLLRKLNVYKSTVIMGDMNVCHENHDICNPERSKNRVAGFLNLERQQFRRYFQLGYFDSFRLLYPLRLGAFTWWNRRFPHLRQQNKGWRLDYIMVNKNWGSSEYGAKSLVGEEEDGDIEVPLPPLQAFTKPYNPFSCNNQPAIGDMFKKASSASVPPPPPPTKRPVPERQRPAPHRLHPVLDCVHHVDVYGSDHCPISATLRFPGPQ